MIVEQYPVVTETFIRDQAQLLDCKVLVLRSNAAARQNLPESATIIRLSRKLDGRHGKFSFQTKWRRLTKGKYPLFELTKAELREAARSIEASKATALLVQFGGMGVELSRISPSLIGRMVVHFHGVDASSMLRFPRYRQGLQRLAVGEASAVVVNDSQRKRLIDLGWPSARIALIPYGIRGASFDSSALAGRIRKWIALGRFVEKKAPLITVAAFARHTQEYPTAQLVFVGAGPLLGSAKALAKALGADSHIEFTGALPHQDAMSLMSSSQGFIQHSISSKSGDEEGWPLAIAEAAVRAKAIVATHHAGIPSQVPDNQCSLLVDETDEIAMSQAMNRIASDSDLANRLRFAARARMLTSFSRRNQIGELRSFIHDHINRFYH